MININVIHDRIPLAVADSPCSQRRDHGEEFTPQTPSFVERDGFMTISSKEMHKEMRLPRWVPSPTTYRVERDGGVFGRHFTQDRLHKVANSVEEWKFEMLKSQKEYLEKNGYTLEDVYE